MPDFSVRADSIDVEQIMRQIRARIRDKRGADYTEAEIRELASVKLDKFLDPRAVRSDLLLHYRRERQPTPLIQPEEAHPPLYNFDHQTVYVSDRGAAGKILTLIRKILKPISKLFFHVDTVWDVLTKQSRLNTQHVQFFQRIHQRLLTRDELDSLNFEMFNNLVVEITRLGIENKNLRMQVESFGTRLDFDERRARALEGVVQYKPGAPVARPQPPVVPGAAPGAASATGAGAGTGAAAGGGDDDDDDETTDANGESRSARRRRRRRGRRRGPGGGPGEGGAEAGASGSTESETMGGGREADQGASSESMSSERAPFAAAPFATAPSAAAPFTGASSAGTASSDTASAGSSSAGASSAGSSSAGSPSTGASSDLPSFDPPPMCAAERARARDNASLAAGGESSGAGSHDTSEEPQRPDAPRRSGSDDPESSAS
jgi:hypothetical protein